MRVERIVDEKAILHELNTYNELVPSEGNLAATLLIEYQTPEERQEHLPKLLGVEERVCLRIGDLAPARAEFDRRQIGESRVSSVQYMRFPLNAPHREAWLSAARAGSLLLGIDHPHYTHETVISSATAEALAADFS